MTNNKNDLILVAIALLLLLCMIGIFILAGSKLCETPNNNLSTTIPDYNFYDFSNISIPSNLYGDNCEIEEYKECYYHNTTWWCKDKKGD